MKFKLKITKDILAKAERRSPSSCAFAAAYNELIPDVHVLGGSISFTKRVKAYVDNSDIWCLSTIATVKTTLLQEAFIEDFDECIEIEGEPEFDVEIPDEVIAFHYGDATKAVQKLIDNPVLKPVYDTVDA